MVLTEEMSFVILRQSFCVLFRRLHNLLNFVSLNQLGAQLLLDMFDAAIATEPGVRTPARPHVPAAPPVLACLPPHRILAGTEASSGGAVHADA